MRLLSTDRAELHFFNSPEEVPGGYAILSHVWGRDEQSFQDLEALRIKCAKIRTKSSLSREKSKFLSNPRNQVGSKIRESCILAEKHGWKWIWIDTCCIDKTSSAELSEAINSMFRYYALSGVCYAYLRSVSTLDDVYAEGKVYAWSARFSEFGRDEWHRRGWTLQELLAPQFVIFVSGTTSWTVLGDKTALAPALKYITGIPEAVLRLEQDLSSVSVADRMLWAAPHKTTRPEDEAYCLVGIFGVSLPTLYGEGRRAFYRLQEEIMKTSTDPSLFAWGERVNVCVNIECHNDSESQHLLAPSPASFIDSTGRTAVFNDTAARSQILVHSHNSQDKESGKVLAFSVTPHGIRAHMPIIPLSPNSTTGYIAFLLCNEIFRGIAYHLALMLLPSPESTEASPPLFLCGTVKDTFAQRLVRIPQTDLLRGPRPMWTTLYISTKPPFRSDVVLDTMKHSPAHRALRFTNMTNDVPFRIPPSCHTPAFFTCTAISPEMLRYRWMRASPLALRYTLQGGGKSSFTICLGICDDSGEHWAHLHNATPEDAPDVSTDKGDDDPEPPPPTPDASRPQTPTSMTMSACDEHDCTLDHISSWPGASTTLSLARLPEDRPSFSYKIALQFLPCLMNESGETQVMDLSVRIPKPDHSVTVPDEGSDGFLTAMPSR